MKIWSDTEYVYRCLADRERTAAFKSAIEKVVKPGDVVLDLGTGSGVMAIFAAKAGARKVYAVEIGDYLSRVSRANFVANGYAETIVPLRMNAREVSLAQIEKPQVVVCEMITTGLIGEMQGPVINSLKGAGIIDAQTLLVPGEISTTAALVSANFDFYGTRLRFPLFIDYFTKSFDSYPEVLSREEVAHTVTFASNFSEAVRIRQSLRVEKEGIVNGLMQTSTTGFVGGAELGACVSYCQPVILPLEETTVSEGDTLDVIINYQMGEGFDSLNYEVSAAR
ncbi:MAG: 50S ribosomal protein L11 methyltransferase [Pyrinomonadaceae bacterium]